MPSLINSNIQLAVESLRKNRGRTFLSALGIAIGVASIVLILSLTGGVNRLVSTSANKNNNDLILVRPSNGKNLTENIIGELTSSNQYSKSSLTFEDLEAIKKIDHVASVAPLAVSSANLKIGDKSTQPISVLATTPNFAESAGLTLKNGQFLASSLQENVAVIGYKSAMQLFGTTDAITKTFTYNDQHFMIIGVLDELNDPINYNNVDLDHSVIININFASTFESSIQIQQINVRTKTSDAIASVRDEIDKTLQKNKNGTDSYQIVSGNDNLHPTGSLLSIVSGMLTLIASISLVVGGIGVMNIMLVSVAERTREIGIRKAVGASASHILLQFLFEAIILSVLGGILGFILGYILAFLVSLVTPFAPFISWQILAITGVVTLLIGIVFGVYPAAKASTRDPITSLKYYR
ncbi:ABC transporter permease [Candidatus Saccharibacteria bacterium]|nr:ABC transporter permease [Candidatus Saccharibacteria bacterium]MBR0482836.1 ABC transporter permease [Candidatus Saccharibacteria bacterium]